MTAETASRKKRRRRRRRRNTWSSCIFCHLLPFNLVFILVYYVPPSYYKQTIEWKHFFFRIEYNFYFVALNCCVCFVSVFEVVSQTLRNLLSLYTAYVSSPLFCFASHASICY